MATRYWVGGSGNWNSTNTGNWSATSGGSSGASAPVSGDDVVFDGNSDSGGPFTVTVVAAGPTIRNLTVSGLDQAMTLAGSTTLTIQGNISLPASNFAWDHIGAINLTGTASSRTILTNGVTINGSLNFNSSGSDWTLQSALTMGSNDDIALSLGTLNTAGYNVTCRIFNSSTTGVRALTLGTTTLTCTFAGVAFTIATSTNMTLSAASSTIALSAATAKTFSGGGLTYGTLANTGAGALTVVGNNSFADWSASLATTFTLTAGSTQTFTNFTLSGTAGNLVTLDTTSAGSAATVSKASGTVNASYLSIKDSTATGGATWNATNSTNVSGNTGWNFVASGAEVIVPLSSLTLAGYAPVILTGANVDVPLSSITFAGQTPTIATGANVEVGVSTISLTAYAPSVGEVVNIIVPLSTLVLTANAPTISTPSLSALARITLTGRFSL